MPLQALAAAATLLAAVPHGDRIELKLDRGAAEIVWVSDAVFRFRRSLDGALAEVTPLQPANEITVAIEDTPGAVRLRSKLLEVSIRKRGALVSVRRTDGLVLMTDFSEPRAEGAGVAWERLMPAGERFYGLGPRSDADLELRGKTVSGGTPFLLCSAGYGVYHAAPGPYRFDFRQADRYRVVAPAVDYLFYHGLTPKRIFEEHNAVRGAAGREPAQPEGGNSWAGLRDSLLRLVHRALSIQLEPAFDLLPYGAAPAELQRRARQLGSLVPDVIPGPAGVSDLRSQLKSFFAIYEVEVRDRGFPIWRPLPFQFPEDAECARHADEFLLGDEMLIAPIYTPGGKRTVYLPRGVWTNLESNQTFEGKHSIEVETEALPVFAHNGTIVPLDSNSGIALHYFPKLAGEFFLLESDGDYSQVHAAPAADAMRLEIESKKEHTYQWVVHHVDRPVSVGSGDEVYPAVETLEGIADRTWFYDARSQNLHVRLKVSAGEDSIVNLAW